MKNSPYAVRRMGCNSRRASNATCNARKHGMVRTRKAIAGLAVLLSALLLTSGIALAGSPGWIVSCNYSHSVSDDPIVFPGQPGASHLHDFIGARTTNASSTPESLRAGGTTCVMPGDSSGYWVPALFKNGVRVLPTATSKNALFYYRRGGIRSETVLQTIPDGLKIIVGNAQASSAAQNEGIATGRIIFKCGPGSGTDLPAPPAQCASGVMVVSYKFPNCWDGVNLDSPNHKSHMAYPASGRCPSTHPVAIPRLEAFVRYPVGTSPIGTITLASGAYFTAHMDFWNAWKPAVLNWLLDNCINAGRDCGKNPAVPLD